MITLKSFFDGWNKFFFEPRPTEGIAVFRIIWFSLLFVYYLFDLHNINDFYGPHAILSLETVKNQFSSFHANIFHIFGPSYETVYGVIVIYGTALVMALVGFHTRFAMFLVLILMTSLHQRNIWLLSSSELLMRGITILLLCSPCGHTLSIDSWLGRKYTNYKKDRDWAPWAWRLIQIQISVVYLWTVWHKLKGSAWFDGSAVYYATRIESMTNFTIPYLMDSLVFLKISTWGTLILEVSLGTLIWFKEFRKPLILAGICFHFGIEYLMSIPFFELIMIALLLNFFTPEEYRVWINQFRFWIISLMSKTSMQAGIKEDNSTI